MYPILAFARGVARVEMFLRVEKSFPLDTYSENPVSVFWMFPSRQ